MRQAVFTVLALTAAAPALAQTHTGPAPIKQPGPPRQVAPGTPPGTVVVPDGAKNGGPGTTAVIAPTGTGAATITTDTAAGGNASQPERGVPQTGGGGSGDNGGG
ncbi:MULTISPECIES: hypothetical protein [unclassified Methylobacterium]|uniref:hypothetical protein n=1 Tax=unclassified Methylobacterium TaxID=2615210 RepID=UPI0011C1EF93|nr:MULTISPECIES: hypothetical protein [unclassified Methylobacterium]QEE42987.1 hypothetical protein FVA80_25325 [Methylobacterium sp. WL1]TXN00699.1 hypothetical protein FV242_21235 [Methylobacterium sp. WL64]TXN56111.1 hypothetical protein FV241_17085 [Methylobacterium sp. WL2]